MFTPDLMIAAAMACGATYAVLHDLLVIDDTDDDDGDDGDLVTEDA